MAQAAFRSKLLHNLMVTAAIAGIYFATALVGNLFVIEPARIPLVWLHSAVAVVAVVLVGWRALPGIGLGAYASFCQNAAGVTVLKIVWQYSLPLALIALGQAYTIKYLLARLHGVLPGKISFSNLRNLAAITFLPVIFGASLSTIVLYRGGYLEAQNLIPAWLGWLLGNWLSVTLFTPMMQLIYKQLKGQPPAENTTPALVALGVGLVLVMFVGMWNLETQSIAVYFQDDSEAIVTAVQRQVDTVTHDLNAVNGLFISSAEVTHQEYDAYVQATHFNHGETQLDSLAWAAYVPGEDRQAFEAAARLDGQPGYQIVEADAAGNLAAAGARAAYYPVQYLKIWQTSSPPAGSGLTPGLDLAADPGVRAALERARQTGELVLIPEVLLAGLPDSGRYLLAIKPVWRVSANGDQFLGAAVGVINTTRLIQAAVEPLLSPGLSLQIFDQPGIAQAEPQALFTAAGAVSPFQASLERIGLTANFLSISLLDWGGPTWQVVVTADPEYSLVRRSPGPWLTILAGLAFVTLAGMYLVRRQTDAARILETQNLYRLLAENISDVVWILDLEEQRFRYVSPSVLSLRGYTAEEVLSQSMTDAVTADSAAYLAQVLPERIAEFQAGQVQDYVDEITQPRRDGTRVITETRTRYSRNPHNGHIEVFGSSRDVTERKRAEEELRRSRAQMAQAQEIAHIGNYVLDFSANTFIWSDEHRRITGWGQAAASHDKHNQIVHPADYPHAHEVYEQGLVEGKYDIEYRIIRPDGAVRWVRDQGLIAEKSPEGAALLIYGALQDITEQKRTRDLLAARLRLSEFAARHSLDELIQNILDEAEQLTDSQIGFFHFVSEDQNNLTLQTWSTNTLTKMCNAEGKGLHYTISQAGVWVNCLKDLQPLVINDYPNHPEKKGLPTGHAPVQRLISLPVLRSGKVVAITGVGNKGSDYNTQDEEIFARLIDAAWDIVLAKRAEVELRESEERYRKLVETTPDAILVLRGELIVFANPAAAQLLGAAAPEALVGMQYLDFVRRDYHDSVMSRMGRPALGQQFAFLERKILRLDGKPLDVEIGGVVINYEGQIAVQVIVRDISTLKRLANDLAINLEKYRVIFESFPLGITVTDNDGKIIETNKISEQILGVPTREHQERTIASPAWMIIDQDGQPFPADDYASVRALRENRIVENVEMGVVKSDGNVTWISVTAAPIPLEDYGVAITYADISARKQAENELREAHAELERRVAERTADLSRVNAELGRALRIKDEFLANMSHELRTPLNGILALSESLLEQVRGPLNERQARSVQTIEQSGRHLLALINDILDLSKIEAGKIEIQLETILVSDICEASLMFISEIAQKKNLRVNYVQGDDRWQIRADQRRLKQILVNLLNNAVKFTPAGGQVSLSVTAEPETGSLRFVVEDTGQGIPPEFFPRLFSPFTQLDSGLARRHEGTGLGLALVRRLVELHGGSVTVESAGVPGLGSRFTVTLPWEAQTVTRGRDTGELKLKGRKFERAVVLEDSPSAAEQLARYLENLGLAVRLIAANETILEQILNFATDLIFLDLLMPGISGWDILKQLKADPRTSAIPVVIVSVVDDRPGGLAAGAAEYLLKPISRDMVRQAVYRIASQAVTPLTPVSEPTAPSQPGAGATILLAEDNEINSLAISEYLQDVGYTLVLARDGGEAIARAAECSPQVIIMDIQMPGFDGLEAIRQLRAEARFAQTPIIALTALVMPGDRERCLAAGADEYLTKPVSLKTLNQMIKSFLEKTRNLPD